MGTELLGALYGGGALLFTVFTWAMFERAGEVLQGHRPQGVNTPTPGSHRIGGVFFAALALLCAYSLGTLA